MKERARTWAAVSDFDGTITLRDVGDHLLLHYGFSDRKTIEASYSLKVRVEDQVFRVPFPRDILRHAAYDIKPKKLVSIGVIEAVVEPALPGRRPTIKVRLDDSLEARRAIVQSIIRDMGQECALEHQSHNLRTHL